MVIFSTLLCYHHISLEPVPGMVYKSQWEKECDSDCTSVSLGFHLDLDTKTEGLISHRDFGGK